jgi:hypothetical protein
MISSSVQADNGLFCISPTLAPDFLRMGAGLPWWNDPDIMLIASAAILRAVNYSNNERYVGDSQAKMIRRQKIILLLLQDNMALLFVA